MKKIFMLVIASTILFSVSAQPAKDTCPCPKSEVKTPPKSPRQWKQPRTTQIKGLITGSFNDSIVIEDHTGGGYILPEVIRIPERFYPPVVSNLKEIKGSFNRHISVKVFPYPNRRCYYWHDDFSWLLLPLLLLGLIALIVYLATRSQQAPSVEIQNNIPPAPPAPAGNRSAVAPAVDLKDLYEKAEKSGSTIVVFPDGGFKIIPPVKKEEKLTTEVKPDKKEGGGVAD